MSPLAMTTELSDAEMERLHAATVATLRLWAERLCGEAEVAFPEKVTAFRQGGMAVHGRHGRPCPACAR